MCEGLGREVCCFLFKELREGFCYVSLGVGNRGGKKKEGYMKNRLERKALDYIGFYRFYKVLYISFIFVGRYCKILVGV